MANKGSFKKGIKKNKQGQRGKGRITTELRQAILESFDRIGGVDWLVSLAKRSPSSYCGLLAKVLPVNIRNADPEAPLFSVQPIYTVENPLGTDQKLSE